MFFLLSHSFHGANFKDTELFQQNIIDEYIIMRYEKTRRERLKSALYLRLKKCFHEKLRKQFRKTQGVPFMLHKTRKPLSDFFSEISQNAENPKEFSMLAKR